MASDSARHNIGERGYCLFVSNFNDYQMVHIRKIYQDKPTQYFIALTHKEWKIQISKTAKLNNLIEQMQKAISNCEKELESETYPIGLRGIFSVITDFEGKLYIHVRKFNDNGKPTKTGVSLTDKEFKELIDISKSVNIDMIIEKMRKESTDNSEAKRCAKRKSSDESKIKRKLFKATV